MLQCHHALSLTTGVQDRRKRQVQLMDKQTSFLQLCLVQNELLALRWSFAYVRSLLRSVTLRAYLCCCI